MAIILNIETATNACSVVLAKDGIPLIERIRTEGRGHSELLGVFVDEVLTEAEGLNLKLDAVAVSAGPGSYTGLRIGVSLAKGLCFGNNIPLIAVDTLSILVFTAIGIQNDPDGIFVPLIDARRMEVYSAIYDGMLEMQRETMAEVIDENTYQELNENKNVYLIGDGALKCKGVVQHPKAVFMEDVVPLAKHMTVLAEKAFQNKQFEDVAYFEPYYLKSFLVTTSKKDVLGRGK